MNPFGTRAGAEQLARLLDGGVDAGAAALHAPAVTLAARLSAAGHSAAPAPRAEFRAALRTRLVAVAGVQAAAPAVAAAGVPAFTPRWASGRRTQRGVAVAAGAMALVIAVTGVAVASSQALPGDPFYGVKREAEALQLQFAQSNVDRGTRHLEFAETRLQEVRGLTLGRRVLSLGTGAEPLAGALAFGGGVAARVRSTLADMDRETSVGTRLLTTAYRDTRSAAPLRILTAFAGRQSETLQTLLPELPAADRDQAQSSLSLVTSVGQQAGVLLSLGDCTEACNPANAAPTLPTSAPAGPTPDPSATGDVPCTCPPSEQPATEPTPTTEPVPSPSSTATPSPTASPTHSPTPSPRPTPTGLPVPLPTSPVPLPTLPVPVPTSPAPLPVPIQIPPTTLPSSSSARLPLLPTVITLPSLLPHP